MESDIPANWTERRVDEICSIRAGGAFKRDLQGRQSGQIPFIKVSDMNLQGNALWIKAANNWVETSDLKAVKTKPFSTGSVVFAKIGEGLKANRFRILTQETLIDNNMMGATPIDGQIDAQFLFYRLLEANLPSLAGGSALPYLRASDVNQLKLAIPPLEEQRRIAGVLGSLDHKIELNRKMVSTLNYLVSDYFREIVAQGEEWEEQELGDCLEVIETGTRPKGGVSKYSEGVPSIGAESIVQIGIFNYSKLKYIPKSFHEKMSRGKLRSRDVLLYKDGGRPGMFEPHVSMVGDGFPFEEAAINEHVYRLRAKESIGQAFLYYWLSSESAKEEMRSRGTGVAVPGLNSTQVRSLAVSVPPAADLLKFNSLAEPSIAAIFNACNENRQLELIRDELRPKLLAGTHRVPETYDPSGVLGESFSNETDENRRAETKVEV